DSSLIFGWYGPAEGRVIVPSAGYTLNINAWNKVDFAWDSAIPESKLYINGTQVGATNTADGTWTPDPTASFTLATDTGNGLASGSGDEARVSNVARSAAWLQAEYNNQLNPAAFWTVGAEVATGAGGGGAFIPLVGAGGLGGARLSGPGGLGGN